MKLSVFGIGYVGCVSAACFAKEGHDVIGVDVNPTKVEIINSGNSPIVEPGVGELMKEAVNAGRLRATTRINEAVNQSEISLVCVGTPSNVNGSLDLRYITRVCEEIGAALKTKQARHVVVMRSTMLPGTIENVVMPSLERTSGKKAGRDFGVCINPEFLREGSSLKDFYAPPFTLIGADDKTTAESVRRLYESVDAPLFETAIKTAEMIKYVCNSFHALKVSFANEVGNICKALAIDSHEVMEIFCQDTKLNLSSYYMKPGFAFGGSCLPKDLRAMLHKARQQDLELPTLGSLLISNQKHLERAYALIKKTGKMKVGVLGLSFKAGTDDLRESPTVALIETLIGKGYQISIYDEEVSLAKVHGANKRFIEQTIPHISSLMKSSVREVIEDCEVIVVSKRNSVFEKAMTDVNAS